MRQFPRKGTRYRIYGLKGRGGAVTHGVQWCAKFSGKGSEDACFTTVLISGWRDRSSVVSVLQRIASWEAMLVFGLGGV